MDHPPHGGRLRWARERYPGAPEPFIDLSTGINPNVYPHAGIPQAAFNRLPEPEDLARLEAVAAQRYGVRDAAMVVAAPGTQALIQLLPRLAPQAVVAVPAPTYSEHAAAWRQAGAAVEEGPPRPAIARVLCNPNNPDGGRHDPAALALLAQALPLLVVDEAYADFEAGLSLAPFLPLPRVVILRSFGKTYGLAGLRLGFALLDAEPAARLRRLLGPWPVSGPAIVVGTAALADQGWFDAAAATARAAAHRLDDLLAQAQLRVAGGTSLFRLVGTPDGPGLADHLSRAGILVRHFASNGTHVRLGLPPDEPAWERLGVALASY